MPDAASPAPQPHLYLVDGSSYIFRAYHVLPPLTNRHGVNVGAVYGYTSMLWKLADSLNKEDGPTHLAVILDASSHTHRNELYDQYKANRPPPPEDLVPQFPLTTTQRKSVACNAGISKRLLMETYGLTQAQANSFFANPTTLRLNVGGSARFVDRAVFTVGIRILGD